MKTDSVGDDEHIALSADDQADAALAKLTTDPADSDDDFSCPASGLYNGLCHGLCQVARSASLEGAAIEHHKNFHLELGPQVPRWLG